MYEKSSRTLSTSWPRMTPAARDRVSKHLADGCYCHGTTATLTRRIINACVVVHLQCDGCGRGLSGGLARADHYFWQSYPEWDQALVDAYREEWQSRHEARLLDLSTAREIEAAQNSKDYAEGCRTSTEWRALSLRVMRRAQFQCEACLSAPAAVVHHLTYRFGRLPPAWALRAVCHGCHDRLHAHKQGEVDEWSGDRMAG